MKNRPRSIRYGNTDIPYELLRCNRRSLEIAVHPPLPGSGRANVVVKAPLSSPLDAVEAKVKKRARWIKRQLTFFSQFIPRTPERRYVGGESHLYLGRRYRLKIEPPGGALDMRPGVSPDTSPNMPPGKPSNTRPNRASNRESNRNKVVLKDGYFVIPAPRDAPDRIKRLLESWYKNRAEVIFPEVFAECWEKLGRDDLKNLIQPSLAIRKMDKRWGSLSKKGRLTLNRRLIQAPRDCIEYVVVHELCHLIHHNHGTDFYRLLDRTMPDWTKRKQRLELGLA